MDIPTSVAISPSLRVARSNSAHVGMLPPSATVRFGTAVKFVAVFVCLRARSGSGTHMRGNRRNQKQSRKNFVDIFTFFGNILALAFTAHRFWSPVKRLAIWALRLRY